MEIEKIPRDELQVIPLTIRHEIAVFESKNDGIKGYPYHKYPSIKIARLAVDKRYERQGVGGFLVLAAIGLAMSVSEVIGCRYVTVDSKPESISFYEKLGFKIVEKYRHSEFPKMYLDMYPIVAMMQPKESLEEFEG